MNTTMKHLKTLSWDNLVYLEADANYTLLHMKNGEKVHSSFTLKLHHEHFTSFIRPSSKFLVNPKFIRKVDKVRTKLVTINGRVFRISRRRVDGVLELLNVS